MVPGFALIGLFGAAVACARVLLDSGPWFLLPLNVQGRAVGSEEVTDLVEHLCRSAGRVITFPLGTDRRLRLVRAALCRKIRRDHGVDLASVAPPTLVVDAANDCLRIDGRAHVQAVGHAGFDFRIGTPSGDESLIVTADEAVLVRLLAIYVVEITDLVPGGAAGKACRQ